MVEHDVRRLVYAGSNHAVGRTPRTERLGTDVRPRPDTFYGVAKVAAEALMSLYADRYGIDAVSCRIGSFLRAPETVRNLSTWLSHDDCVRMVEAALTTPAPGLRRPLRHLATTPAPGGTSSPAARWATSRRTTPRTSGRPIVTAPADDVEAAYVGRPVRHSGVRATGSRPVILTRYTPRG